MHVIITLIREFEFEIINYIRTIFVEWILIYINKIVIDNLSFNISLMKLLIW